MDEAMSMENPTGRGEPVDQTVAGAAGGTKLDPAVYQMQVKKYNAVIIHLMYSEEMRADVLAMIDKSDDPFITVPTAVNQIIKEVDRIFEKQGIKISNEVRLAGASVVLADLLEIGKAKGFFEIADDEIEALLEDTIQMYVQRGLEDGSIDPIQLQIDTEQLMTKEQRAAGQAFAQKHGVPTSLSSQQIMEQYGNSKAREARLSAEDKFSKERAKMQQRPPQQPPQPLPQGGQ